MSETTTAAPSFANLWAIARPHPVPPDPVTIDTESGTIAGQYTLSVAFCTLLTLRCSGGSKGRGKRVCTIGGGGSGLVRMDYGWKLAEFADAVARQTFVVADDLRVNCDDQMGIRKEVSWKEKCCDFVRAFRRWLHWL